MLAVGLLIGAWAVASVVACLLMGWVLHGSTAASSKARLAARTVSVPSQTKMTQTSSIDVQRAVPVAAAS